MVLHEGNNKAEGSTVICKSQGECTGNQWAMECPVDIKTLWKTQTEYLSIDDMQLFE